MKKLKVEAHISIGYANASRKEIIEVEIDDEVSVEEQEDQINEEVQAWANNYIEVSWNEL